MNGFFHVEIQYQCEVSPGLGASFLILDWFCSGVGTVNRFAHVAQIHLLHLGGLHVLAIREVGKGLSDVPDAGDPIR